MPVKPIPLPDATAAPFTDIGPALAARIRIERIAREWSLEELSRRAGVSRGMISKIEREECSPTATILGRLSGAFGISMSALLANAEAQGKRLLRCEEQQVLSLVAGLVAQRTVIGDLQQERRIVADAPRRIAQILGLDPAALPGGGAVRREQRQEVGRVG